MTTEIYFAEYSYNPSLTKFTVEEKQKSYIVKDKVFLVGWSHANRIKKDDERVHLTLNGALFYLAELAKEHMEAAKDEYERKLAEHNIFNDIAEKMKVDPECAERAITELLDNSVQAQS